MQEVKPNHERIRPSRSFTLSWDSVAFLDEASRITGKPRSVVLDEIISDQSLTEYLDSTTSRQQARKEEVM